jgi:hypothetical protein
LGEGTVTDCVPDRIEHRCASKPLSHRERGWGQGTVADCVPDRIKHRFGLKQDVIVPKPQDAPALRFEVSGSRCIYFIRVLRAIQFDDQPCGDTTEIGNTRWDRMLATELHFIESSSPEVLPKLSFGIGHVTTQSACVVQRSRWQWRFDRCHFAAPSPQPLSRGERGVRENRDASDRVRCSRKAP